MSIGFLSLLSGSLCCPADEMEAISSNQYVGHLGCSRWASAERNCCEQAISWTFCKTRTTGCVHVRSQEIYSTVAEILFILQQSRAVKSSYKAYELEVRGFVWGSNTHTHFGLAKDLLFTTERFLWWCPWRTWNAGGGYHTRRWGNSGQTHGWFCSPLSNVDSHEFRPRELAGIFKHSCSEKTGSRMLTNCFWGFVRYTFLFCCLCPSSL